MERFYERQLRRRLRVAKTIVREELTTLLLNRRDEIDENARVQSENRKRAGEDKRRLTVIKNRYDSIGDLQSVVKITTRRVTIAYFSVFTDLETLGLSQEVFDRTQKINKAALEKGFKQVLGASPLINDRGLRDMAAQFTAENVRLIRNMEESVFAGLEEKILEGLDTGLRHEELVADIQERLDVGENRARLIARDQTQKANSSLNEMRQTNLGITHYVWETSDDERVRDTHVENDGKTFSWAEPPEITGHPGNDINCRCVAKPIIESLFDDFEIG